MDKKRGVPPDFESVNRLLSVIETEIVPLTREDVQKGNKVFGAAILRKQDLSVVIAATNEETSNPLWHGEVNAIKKLYEMPRSQRPDPKETVSLRLTSRALCVSRPLHRDGYDSFYYLFSHEDSRDSFNIPHDLRILKEFFTLERGGYASENFYWKSYDLIQVIDRLDEQAKSQLLTRADQLKSMYPKMSEVYQKNRGDHDIPLKSRIDTAEGTATHSTGASA